MGYQTLLIEVEEGVGWLTFNRPNKKNAMSPRLHMDMAAALDELRYNPDVRVVVITGAGNSFCSGMDLKEFFTDLQDQPVRVEGPVGLEGGQGCLSAFAGHAVGSRHELFVRQGDGARAAAEGRLATLSSPSTRSCLTCEALPPTSAC
jgi:enoyl-CoA hydratase/carnithine racemase